MSYLTELIKNLDEEGRHVFQGVIMAGYSPRQAILNAYGICCGDELTNSPFHAYHIQAGLPSHVADAIFVTPEDEIERTFWKVWENR